MTHRARITRAFCRFSALLITLLVVPACTGIQTYGADAREPIETDIPVTIASRTVPGDAISAETLFAEGRSTYSIVSGSDKGGTLTITTERSGDRGREVRTLEGDTLLSEARFEFGSGTVTEHAFDNHERDVSVKLDPKQQLWPVDGREQSFTIRLPRVSNPKSIREKGTATATMTVESIDTVETPAGTFQAVRVRIDFRSDLSAANAHRVRSAVSPVPAEARDRARFARARYTVARRRWRSSRRCKPQARAKRSPISRRITTRSAACSLRRR